MMPGNVMQCTQKALNLLLLLSVIVTFMSGCATTGTSITQDTIEVVDNYNVDSEIKAEFELAVEKMQNEQFEEAIKLLKGVTGKARKFTAPYINLAIAYKKTGDLKKAEESLDKALKLNKRHPAANNELGLVYRNTGRFTEARSVYEYIIKEYPGYLPARKNLGILCDLYLRDLNCALQQYQAYLQVLPGDEKVKIWVADLKNRM